MISHQKALEIILQNANIQETELVELTNSNGRILSETLSSEINMPPFDKSAVDGYACKRKDLPGPLKIIEVIKAGQMPTKNISDGTCSKIMTGAPIPKDADIVIMIEKTELTDNQSVILKSEEKSTNICLLGEDIKSGQEVIERGTLIKPWHVGTIATIGFNKVPVFKKVKIGIITTGDELVEPGEKITSGKIINSNAYQLLSSCNALPIITKYYGIVKDDLKETISVISKAIEENEIVLITGGVSMGDYDFVPIAIKEVKMNILFDSVAIQPGRPLTYATNGQKHCFGLPGNPASSLIQFELSVKPLIYKMMGHNYQPKLIPLKLGKTINRKKVERKSFYPVEFNDDSTVIPINYHGSAHINAFTNAYGLIYLDTGIYSIEKGETVYVRPLQ